MAKEATEQAKGAGTEEKTKGQDAKKPSSVSEGFRMFMEKQSEKAKGKSSDEPSDKTQKESKTESLRPEEDKAVPTFRIVDAEGNEIPFTMKVDGKDIQEQDLSKVITWAQLGYHGNKRLEEVNLKEKGLDEREQELQKQMEQLKTSQAMLDKFRSAIEEGRLIINPPGTQAASQKETEEQIDEDLYAEPGMVEIKKENIHLKKQMQDLTKKFEATNQLLLGKLVRDTKDVLDADIAKAKEKYPLLSEKEVWDLLAEVDESNRPKYDVEAAAKLSNENEQKRFSEFIKSNPEFLKKDEEERKKIIAEYLEKKSASEEAPVSAPSSGAAQTPSTTPKKPKEYKSMKEAMDDAIPWLQKKLAAKKQF